MGVRVREGRRDQEQLMRAREGWGESESVGEVQRELERAMEYGRGQEGFKRTRKG